mgnify:CR=1 FL=1
MALLHIEFGIMQNKLANAVLLGGLFLTGIFITPQYSSEPIDLPKLFILLVTGFGLAGYVIFLLIKKTSLLKLPSYGFMKIGYVGFSFDIG